jgi:hypothetical protein
MADLNGKFGVVTFTEYLGLGYIFDKGVWNVFPIFADYFEAQKLWNNQVELIEERNFMMRFINIKMATNSYYMQNPFLRQKLILHFIAA